MNKELTEEHSAEFKAGQDDARWKIKFRLLREACQEDAADAALICRLATISCGFPDDPDEKENKKLRGALTDIAVCAQEASPSYIRRCAENALK